MVPNGTAQSWITGKDIKLWAQEGGIYTCHCCIPVSFMVPEAWGRISSLFCLALRDRLGHGNKFSMWWEKQRFLVSMVNSTCTPFISLILTADVSFEVKEVQIHLWIFFFFWFHPSPFAVSLKINDKVTLFNYCLIILVLLTCWIEIFPCVLIWITYILF